MILNIWIVPNIKIQPANPNVRLKIIVVIKYKILFLRKAVRSISALSNMESIVI